MFVYSSICLFSVNFEILKCRSQCREHVIAEQTIWSAAFFRNRANEHSLSIEREIKRKETFYNIQVHKQTQRQTPTVTNFYTQNVRHAILSFSFSLGCSLLFHHLFCIALRWSHKIWKRSYICMVFISFCLILVHFHGAASTTLNPKIHLK